jgi:hypothetical protein
MATLKPFADDSASVEIGGLTIENGTDKIAIYGNTDLTRDKAGLQQVRALKTLIDRIVSTLEADKDLPDQIAPPGTPDEVANPFA